MQHRCEGRRHADATFCQAPGTHLRPPLRQPLRQPLRCPRVAQRDATHGNAHSIDTTWTGHSTMTSPTQADDGTPLSTAPAQSPHPSASAGLPRPMVVLHWLTVLCLVLAASLILLREEVEGRAVRQWLLEGHRHFGLFVLGLFFLRVALRLRLGKRHDADAASPLLRALAGLTHVVMYALLLTLPVLGWALSQSMGKPVHLFAITLPELVAPDPDLADTLGAWHVDAAWALLGLILLHIGAALWHHFVRRDDTLRRMLRLRRG
jgi:cytochrome b561